MARTVTQFVPGVPGYGLVNFGLERLTSPQWHRNPDACTPSSPVSATLPHLAASGTLMELDQNT
eukprot:CAMPEP_0202835848 /NCGR_PEP_ID=MMETSP1389-20130828/38649_1 /ASSEMBLY_ACC=CAM_ASM_000865 /TAXON_ID=302021 /ORGANISM="Rhodomonas sp., Strain CCMP768" /LENGTH=63 /DNA_ID=CAMNT_0049511475 /DNA_START=1 /DNA_END=188 /DNA_ORIENTATION=+